MMLTNVCTAFARPTSRAVRTYDLLTHCAKMVSAEYERKVFLEQQVDAFPGMLPKDGCGPLALVGQS
jgi:hypothetical protein